MRQVFIKHSGVKGMKWGVRRYESSDGTLTPAGKKRYGADLQAGKAASKGLDAASRLGTNKQKSKEVKKDYSKISDTDLRARVNRLNMEKQYGQLSGDTKRMRSGSDYVRETLQNAAIAATIVTSALSVYIALRNTGLTGGK